MSGRVWLLWDAGGSLLGVFSGEHWARLDAQDRHTTRPRLVWRTGRHGESLGIIPGTKRRAAARSLAPTPDVTAYVVTHEEVKP